MNNLNMTIKNNDGSRSTIEAISYDNLPLNIGPNYKLVNYSGKKDSKFKNSLFGSDIGIKSSGFVSITIISTIIAISSFIALIISFRI